MSEQVEAQVEQTPATRDVKIGPVEVRVIVNVRSPDPGGSDDVDDTKGGLGPQ